jgi:transposase
MENNNHWEAVLVTILEHKISHTKYSVTENANAFYEEDFVTTEKLKNLITVHCGQEVDTTDLFIALQDMGYDYKYLPAGGIKWRMYKVIV